MFVLNLHTSVLDSPEVVGAEPVDRATWLFLLRFCIGQENGGRIAGCRKWSDRTWQQVARVTLREVRRPSELWRWHGSDLVVSFYPSAQEAEVRAKREAGKQTAAKRWGQQRSSLDSSATSSPHAERERESKWEVEGRATRAAAAPPHAPPAKESHDQWIDRLTREFPEVDIGAELAAATKWQQARGRKKIERRWFEISWLPRCSAVVGDSSARSEPAPAGWEVWLIATYPHCQFVSAGKCTARSFAQLPPSVQSEAREALRKAS